MKKRIHVNMHHIRHNKKHGTNKPVITVKTSKSNDYGHEVDILGPSKVVWKFNRWHHHVDYRSFKKNELKRKKGLEIKKGINNYGMKVVKI